MGGERMVLRRAAHGALVRHPPLPCQPSACLLAALSSLGIRERPAGCGPPPQQVSFLSRTPLSDPLISLMRPQPSPSPLIPFLFQCLCASQMLGPARNISSWLVSTPSPPPIPHKFPAQSPNHRGSSQGLEHPSQRPAPLLPAWLPMSGAGPGAKLLAGSLTAHDRASPRCRDPCLLSLAPWCESGPEGRQLDLHP